MNFSTELKTRHEKIRKLMQEESIDAALICCNVNLLYTCGQVINGFVYLPVNGEVIWFVKRPNNLTGRNIFHIRKPEQITEILQKESIQLPDVVMLESDELAYTTHVRLSNIFSSAGCVNGTPILQKARSIKTPFEIKLFRKSAELHAKAYRQIPNIFYAGMNDKLFSIEIERLMRLEGCLGIFRIFGQSMEIHMGSVLAGENAETPSPYDFALGGEGLDPSLPIGLNGTQLKKRNTVMVDLGGNFYGYICDMSRVFSIGKLEERAYHAHQICLEIQDKIAEKAKPGVVCEELYNIAIEIVNREKLADNFMGTKQKAGFIGHGIGLEINEAPILAPRVKQELIPGMVFALEPKIVLPGIGPLGIENSWVVNEQGIEKLTLCPEEIIELK